MLTVFIVACVHACVHPRDVTRLEPRPACTRYRVLQRSGMWALVEARVGRGRWIYLGLGLWRQLPAGTDGAYQLLANFISLAKSAAGR